jgi:hypothetical protein
MGICPKKAVVVSNASRPAAIFVVPSKGHAEIWQICLAPADRHDTYTAAGKAFLDMLAVFAEFETNLRNEQQQAERIAAAKPRGVYKGRRC